MIKGSNIFINIITVLMALLILGLGTGMASAYVSPAPVNLGNASNFAILAGSGITFTGAVNSSTVTGDIGVHPTITINGIDKVVLNGMNHLGDAVTQEAKTNLTTAYDDALARTPNETVGNTLGGLNLTPGVYDGGALDLTGTLTLDAQNDPNAVFIFKATSTLITAENSNVILVNGTQARNVFWQVTSSATLGSNSIFKGTILALTAITLNTGANVEGRVLARNAAVTLDDANVISVPITPTFNLSGYKNNTMGTGLVNWNITLYNATSGTFLGFNITNLTGFYEFPNLAPGIYNITEIMQTGWTNFTPLSQNVTIVSSDMLNQNFTNQQLYNLSGYKNNTMGTGLLGWNITLYNATSGTFIGFNITNSTGFYEFPNLAPGIYNVTEAMQIGWTNVTPVSQNVTIVSSDMLNQNFTNQQLYNLSGYKNNTMGTGLLGWNITLYNATTSAFIGFNLTNSSGFYEFPNLAPGIYNVTEIMQTGWTNFTPISQNVTITASDMVNQNFTNQQLFNLSGYKNNTLGTGLPNWNITLYNATTSAFIGFDLTNLTGFYEFPNLAPGIYNVTEIMQIGWTNVTPVSQNVTITSSDQTNQNFTNQQLFNISGYKNDTQGTGLPNWNITLYNSTFGTFLGFNITNSTGFYEFPNLAPGIYNITEIMQSGWTNITPVSQNVTITASNQTNQNFTNQQLYNISGYKNDTQGTGLSNWNITLYNATTSSFIAFNLTNASGFYEFQNLAPGIYNVTEIMQIGWTNFTPISQNVTITASDQTNQNFTNQLITAPNLTSWGNNKTNDHSLTLTTNPNEAVSFNVTANQTVNVTWYINGSEFFNQTDVTNSEYINNSAVAGFWNVTAIVNNANGTDSKTWDWNVTVATTLVTYIPPVPANITATIGNFWVNTTWQTGEGNITTSYNVSVNGSWTNGSMNKFANNTLSAHAWQNVSVYAFNSSGGGMLNSTPISLNMQIPNNGISISNVSANYSILEGQTLYIGANFADADTDTGTFARNFTQGLFNTGTGVISWNTVDGDRGTYSWQINVTDGYGSVDVINFTVTVTPTTTSGTRGTGGGASTGGCDLVTSEPYDNIEKSERYDKCLIANSSVTYIFKVPEISVYEIAVTGKENENDIALRVELLKGTSKLVTIHAPGIVYKNVNILTCTKRMKEALIRFRIENSWIESNSLDGSDIKMVKWNGSQWTQIETVEKTRDDIYNYYETNTKTDTFFVFAITGLKGGVIVPTAMPDNSVTETPVKSTVTATPAPAPTKVPRYGIVLVVAAFCLVYLFRRKR